MKNRFKMVLVSVSVLLCMCLLSACGPAVNSKAAQVQEDRIIPIDPKIAKEEYEDGAVSFDRMLDDAKSKYYVINDYYNMKSEGTLHIIPKFKTYQQTTEYTCGCAAALMVAEYYGVDKYNEMEIADIAKTDDTQGTFVEGLVDFFDQAGFETDYHADTDYPFETEDDAEKFFVESIDAGIPVMVDWVDWGGHWQVVIGIDTASDLSSDDDVLILADPYDVTDHMQDGYYTYPLGRFVYMWREGACADKAEPYVEPYVRAWLPK